MPRRSHRRATVDLMHLVNGRPDLSTAPADHDAGCPRINDENRRCACSTAAGAAPTTPASTPTAPPPHKEKDRSA